MSGEVRVRRDALAPGSAIRLDAGGTAVCLVRLGDDFYAIGDRCSHANVSLSEGQVDPDERCIECWKHGSAFSLEDGLPQSLPAVAPVPVFPVTRDGDDVVVTVTAAGDGSTGGGLSVGSASGDGARSSGRGE